MGDRTTALLHLGLAACLAGALPACSGGSSGGPADTAAPTVVSTAPPDGATGVQVVGVAVSATFSEAMDPATVSASTFVLEAVGPVPGVLDYGGDTATFRPAQLDWATTYRATVTTGAADLAGNRLAAPVSWSFTTAPAPDLTLPEIAGREPAAGATGVSPGAAVVVTFSEPVEAGSAAAGISLSGPGGPVASSVAVQGATATLTPAAPLGWTTTYTVEVGTAVQDLAGNHLLAPSSWSFTTAAEPDATPPAVASAHPPPGATGVDVGVYVSATFSEAVVPATVDASTFQVQGPGGAPVAGTVAPAGYPGASGVDFLPAAPLSGGTTYTVVATAGITDLAGNPLAPYSSSFTTTGAGTGSWTPTAAPTPLEPYAARAGASAVWTGSKVIVWGGWYLGPSQQIYVLATGGRYAPASGTWEAIPSNLPGTPYGRFRHATVWTGSRMIVWGGAVAGSNGTQTGGIYDPAAGAAGGWTATSTSGAPEGRSDPVAVWTGTEMVVWGGWDPTGFDAYHGTGGRYAPGSDTWAATSLAGAPSPRVHPAAVWTGSRMLVWGGLGAAGSLGDGAAYDPVADAWTPMAGGGPSARRRAAAVWTGSKMIVWGGVGSAGFLGDGAAYDPVTDTWSPLPAEGAPPPREEPAAVWTGSRMIVWGGGATNPMFTQTGGAYDPAAGTWALTALAGAPSPRRQPAAAWTGSALVVWGGWGGAGILKDGASWAP